MVEVLRERGLLDAVTNEDALRKAAAEGQLKAYCGFDPTADSLHLGNLLACLLYPPSSSPHVPVPHQPSPARCRAKTISLSTARPATEAAGLSLTVFRCPGPVCMGPGSPFDCPIAIATTLSLMLLRPCPTTRDQTAQAVPCLILLP